MTNRGVVARMVAVGAAVVLVAGCGSATPTRPVDAALPVPTGIAAVEQTPEAVEPSATEAAPAAPVVETKMVKETKRIAYATRTVKDATLASGTKKVRTKGVAGQRTLTYEVTLTDGRQTAKKLVSDVVTRKPVTQVVAVGTRTATRECDPNYSGCVPIASDVDCAGGSGNGPAYVSGPVKVIGDDIYGLDNDDDGYGCD
ncbi:G5 domain-containing protein [Asanoa sp. WMMD1127]|uniref:G5 domain-containing protein n=1 Tax=Asanoa sp. WMMD1127 TaxID=3016107 RepID=UPI00241772EA|nr:G5 domain-containing protein [Asanoa sp. WMMD1127]MDG4826524.1 G5 domain-containing protein [Asanoa sp. WMMD1127]